MGTADIELQDQLSGYLTLRSRASAQQASYAAFLVLEESKEMPAEFTYEEGGGLLPPEGGWGDGNDSSCETCGCVHKDVEEILQERPKMVYPNVPHHSFFPHETGYRLSLMQMCACFLIGIGGGYSIVS